MKNLSYYIIVVILFLGLSNELWSKGMFMDGLYYASIARNLSNGLGSFWQLYFTELDGVFYGHPPLAMGLQSILFSIFGDSIYIERIYSLFTFLITGIFIHLIWKEIIEKKYSFYSWVPLFFWIIIPLNGWACANNFLENTMNMFVSASIFFAIRNIKTEKLIFLVLSAFSLSLAFLSKGFTGLFPLSIFFWFFLIFSKMNFKNMIIKTSWLLILSLAPFLLLLLFYPSAIDSLSDYINIQVIDSIQHSQTTSDRFSIMKELAIQIKLLEIISSITILLYIILLLFQKFNLTHILKDNKSYIILATISLILPMPRWINPLLNYPRIDYIIYCMLIIFIPYIILLITAKLRLINIINQYKWLIFSTIISILFFLTKFTGETFIAFIVLVTVISLIYTLAIIVKKERIINFLKSEFWIIVFSVLSYMFAASKLKYQFFEFLNLYPHVSYYFLILYLCLSFYKKYSSIAFKERSKWIILFILLGISGVLPMIISLKQGVFYMLTALPFFSIALGVLTIPIFYNISSQINKKIVVLCLVSLLICLGPFTSTSTTFLIPYTRYITLNSIKYQYERIARDKPLIDDINLIMNIVPNNTILNIDFQQHWNIHGYFARYGNISLDNDRKNKYKYLISFEDGWAYSARTGKYVEEATDFQQNQKEFNKDYFKIELNTNKLHLYEYQLE